MKKILSVIESAFRATIDEQDDAAVWFTGALKNGGADISVLLRANAVNYAIRGQATSDFAIGDKKLGYPPDISGDLERLIQKGAAVYVVKEDCEERGISAGFIPGLKTISRKEIPALFEKFDLVWHW